MEDLAGIAIFLALAAAVFFIALLVSSSKARRKRDQQADGTGRVKRGQEPSTQRTEKLERYFERLSTDVWKSGNIGAWTFQEASLKGMTETQVATAIIGHVKEKFPAIAVPKANPVVVFEPGGVGQAGSISTRGGWTFIALDPMFRGNAEATNAIICHEVCHYILYENEIKEKNELDNELLTEVFAFVIGLGDVIDLGRDSVRSQYTLGYLCASEYSWLWKHTEDKRIAWDIKKQAEVETLLGQISHRIPEVAERKRLLAHYSEKFRHKDERWRLEKLLSDLERDRK